MKRRICFVGAEITPSEGSTFVGGHVNTVVRLCKGLSDLGWKVHIVTTPSRFLRGVKFNFPWAKMHLIKADGRHNSIKYGTDLNRHVTIISIKYMLNKKRKIKNFMKLLIKK